MHYETRKIPTKHPLTYLKSAKSVGTHKVRRLYRRVLRHMRIRIIRSMLKDWNHPIAHRIIRTSDFYMNNVVPYYLYFDKVLFVDNSIQIRERSFYKEDRRTATYFIKYGKNTSPVIRIRWNAYDARLHALRLKRGQRSGLFDALREIRMYAEDYARRMGVKIFEEYQDSIESYEDEKEAVVCFGSRIVVRIPINIVLEDPEIMKRFLNNN